MTKQTQSAHSRGAVIVIALITSFGADGCNRPATELTTAQSPAVETPSEAVAPTTTEIDPEQLARARDATRSLVADLSSRLVSEMKEGGPAAAIQVCSTEAQEIASEYSIGGLSIRRVSDRVRNEADRPDPYETEQLARLAALQLEGNLPDEVAEVVSGEAGAELRYMKPIIVKPVCLKCHGAPESISSEVRSLIEEKYPHDKAVGYEAGDFRGAVSVRLAIEPE